MVRAVQPLDVAKCVLVLAALGAGMWLAVAPVTDDHADAAAPAVPAPPPVSEQDLARLGSAIAAVASGGHKLRSVAAELNGVLIMTTVTLAEAAARDRASLVRPCAQVNRAVQRWHGVRRSASDYRDGYVRFVDAGSDATIATCRLQHADATYATHDVELPRRLVVRPATGRNRRFLHYIF